jgi:hypothetical protein
MWYLLQGGVIFAVAASNIRWQWTPNWYLASVLGVVAAFLVTVALSTLLKLLRGEPICLPPETPERRAANRREGNALFFLYAGRYVAFCAGGLAFFALTLSIFGSEGMKVSQPVMFGIAVALAAIAWSGRLICHRIARWLLRGDANPRVAYDRLVREFNF